MSLAIKIYEAFKDDETKAKVLSDVVDELDRRTAPLEQKGDLYITKYSLQKEFKELRLTLHKEMENVRKEINKLKPWFIKRFTGLLVVQTGVIITVITLLR